MRTDFPVILDACTLVPPSVCDLYLRLAEEPRLYSPRWTKEILDEVQRAQVNKLSFPERLAAYWREEVTRSFPEALVENYEALISQCTNEEKDRHVLAAAIAAPAYAIVTFNLKHFPRTSTAPYSVAIHHPADYLCTLFDLAPNIVTTKIFEIATQRKRPPQDIVQQLRKTVPRFADYFAAQQGWQL